MNLLKKRKPLVEMWTTVEGLTEIPECLLKPANKFIPDWLKKMKSSFDSPKDEKAKEVKGKVVALTKQNFAVIVEKLDDGISSHD